MILLELFWVFFRVGAFTFGGGYAMVPLISDAVLDYGWMTEAEILNFLAMETVIPGPIAINMATFIGFQRAGFIGSLLATLGVVLPSFIVILLIATVLKKYMDNPRVVAVLKSIRPAVVGLILSTAVTMGMSTLLGSKTLSQPFTIEPMSFVIFGIVIALSFGYKKWKKKQLSPLILICISAVLGIVFFM